MMGIVFDGHEDGGEIREPKAPLTIWHEQRLENTPKIQNVEKLEIGGTGINWPPSNNY